MKMTHRAGWVLSLIFLSGPAVTASAAPPEPAVALPAKTPAAVPMTVPAVAPVMDLAAAPQRASAPAGGTTRARSKTVDSVELERTTITGNRELPNVMVIVPWKPADAGDLLDGPGRSLVDEALAPLDREEFRREVRYHEALLPAPAATTAPGRP